ncbi:hypothetical protein CPC08DRAFT_729447 [Agrocybe pediades]|nr:hypothetical protein CPC08DRAFT_729447 [Agrocybe pediades]
MRRIVNRFKARMRAREEEFPSTRKRQLGKSFLQQTNITSSGIDRFLARKRWDQDHPAWSHVYKSLTLYPIELGGLLPLKAGAGAKGWTNKSGKDDRVRYPFGLSEVIAGNMDLRGLRSVRSLHSRRFACYVFPAREKARGARHFVHDPGACSRSRASLNARGGSLVDVSVQSVGKLRKDYPTSALVGMV